MIKQVIIAAGLLLAGMASNSQLLSLHYAVEYQDLYSTHSDHFRGASITAARPVSSILELGAGVEYAASSFHMDNGWNLYHLRLLPVFVDERLKLGHGRRLHPTLHFAEGVTFSSYGKEIITNPGSRKDIHEAGIYLYGGAGVIWKLTEKFSLVAETGLKSFHVSTNALDVNPHGITGRIGFIL